MGLFSKKKQPVQQPEERAYNIGGLNFNSFSTFSKDQSLRLSAVYCAVNQISNSIALLPISVMENKGGHKVFIENHPLWKVLNLKPDNKYNHYNLFKQLMESVLLRGNGYAMIERDERLNVKAIHYVDSGYVTPIVQKDGTIKYIVAGVQQAVDAANMIDLALHRDNQFRGISVIHYADMCLRGANDAENQAGNFFKSGGNLSGVITPNSPLNNEQKKQIADTWRQNFMNGEPNKVAVAVLPYGCNYQSITRVSPADGELLESRQYSVIEIARFFCIPPSKLMVMDDVSYNSMEMAQLSYLQDCVLPYIQMIKDEFDNKLFKPSEVGKLTIDFDFTSLLTTNMETKANYYRTLLTNGVLSIDDVREKLGYEALGTEASKSHYFQTSYSTIDLIQSGAFIGTHTQDQKQDQNNVDNKAKAKEE